jgi:sortase A
MTAAGRAPYAFGTGRPRAVWIDPSAGAQAGSMLLAMISGTVLFLLINLVLVSQLQHYTTQQALHSELRLSLAEGSTPVAPTGRNGKLVPAGTPLAVMSAGSVGIAGEVIVEGTASAQTMTGIGHRRDTVLPCQDGSSVLMARSGSYGGIGSAWERLQKGDQFSFTMGQGKCTYEVEDSRSPGDKAPAAPTGKEGMLTLTTASGLPFMPTEVARIDAKLIGKSYERPAVSFPPGSLPSAEDAMGSDTSNLFALVLLLEALVAIAIGGTWLWRRWGRWQTWIVIAPVAFTFCLLTATNVNYLLPNLL